MDSPSSDPVVIVSARRTPIGRFLGSFRDLPAPQLGEQAIRAVCRDLPPGVVPDLVIMGCARQAGIGPNPARQAMHRAGLPHTTVAWTLNMACASGMEAVAAGARALLSGETAWVVAGGMESMSRVPYYLDRARTGYRMGDAPLVDGMYKDGFLCPISNRVMGETAETLARMYKIPREEQDAFALRSQQRYRRAEEEGRFASERIEVPLPPVKGSPQSLAVDEHPRADTTAESLARLSPVFASDGTVTPGNSSGISDGAAALLLTRESTANRAGLPARARITAWQSVGVPAETMGIGPVPAVHAILAKTGFKLSDFDLIELNEAFAAQVLAVDRELRFDHDRLNVHGGAISLGHPIGCSGARILVTLLHAMEQRKAALGLATLCVSGGLGMATVLDRRGLHN